MVTPTVVGIGFPKAATTFLSGVLSSHPEVCFSARKETHFFEQNDTLSMSREEAEHIYSGFFSDFDPSRHRLAMEWTVTYIVQQTVLERLRGFFGNDATFLIASRDPIRSALSSYYYHRTISNDFHAARLNQQQCIERHPEVFVEPYLLGTHYRRFRERLPDAKTIVVPHASLKRSTPETVADLFKLLGLSEHSAWGDLPPRNVPYPYRSWRLDKAIRWTLVQLYGNARTKTLYSSPDDQKPALMRFLHGLNKGHYGFEPGVQERLGELLLPDFADFVETVWNDENTTVVGTREDLSEGLI